MYWIDKGYQPYGFPMTEQEGINKDIVQVVVKYEEVSDDKTNKT